MVIHGKRSISMIRQSIKVCCTSRIGLWLGTIIRSIGLLMEKPGIIPNLVYRRRALADPLTYMNEIICFFWRVKIWMMIMLIFIPPQMDLLGQKQILFIRIRSLRTLTVLPALLTPKALMWRQAVTTLQWQRHRTRTMRTSHGNSASMP